ncbi:CYFA0S28e00100g1_1 [Cyberlindnera fabianii]|uniref:Sterol 24-C-methyltransferase n=1 Tax=Cyberlindnera fabianii TaxID=36022 RepID=A0A061BJC6_CYBFA|nr:Sterol 24-C-methyltransferase [Cyberlindnera fabianii]CDR47069.1 CYFA0S28e00100g1_1 [Cyberlindnera fabianii]
MSADLRKTQAEFSKALHGENAGSKSGMGAILSKDKAAQKAAVDAYLKHWDGKTDDEAEKRRLEDYNQSTHSYYNVVTDFYEYGWGTSFHFSRFYKGEPFTQATARHEHYLASKIGIQDGWNVLDVGCGVGGPAREICRFTNCNITGLNNNDYQIEKANWYAQKAGLASKMKFVKGDFMKMDFEPETFDAVYAIEATVHAPVLEGVYGEIYKVLKPGGVFGVYEWVMTDKYDETNEEHRKIAYEIELGDGIPKMYKVDVARQALKNVGFEIDFEKDLADMGDEIPWYYPLTGEWKYVQSLYDITTFFRTSSFGRKITTALVGFMETLGLAPAGSQKVTHALEEAAIGLVAGGKQKLFTPMMLFVAKKPLDAKD